MYFYLYTYIYIYSPCWLELWLANSSNWNYGSPATEYLSQLLHPIVESTIAHLSWVWWGVDHKYAHHELYIYISSNKYVSIYIHHPLWQLYPSNIKGFKYVSTVWLKGWNMFPAFGLNTEICSISLLIQSKRGKCGPEKLWIRAFFTHYGICHHGSILKFLQSFD